MTTAQQNGHILAYMLFDVADEINLETLRSLWSGKADHIGLISRRSAAAYIQFDPPPLLLPLGKQRLQIESERWVEGDVDAKVFDFGVISIRWRLPMPKDWSELLQDAPLYLDSDWITEQSQLILNDLLPALQPSFKKPYPEQLIEDYTIFYVNEFIGLQNAEALLQKGGAEIAQLLRGESKALSPSEVQNALEQRLSYFSDDLVITTWNSALVYEPAGSQEHVEVIEFANAELLELRSYDHLLDQQLELIYTELQELTEKPRTVLFRSPYQNTIQRLLALLIDVAELTDRLENSLKMIGELYSARVYRLMAKVLHLEGWKSRVNSKLEDVRQIYETLNSEASDRRSTLLEVIIVALIFLEIILFLIPGATH